MPCRLLGARGGEGTALQLLRAALRLTVRAPSSVCLLQRRLRARGRARQSTVFRGNRWIVRRSALRLLKVPALIVDPGQGLRRLSLVPCGARKRDDDMRQSFLGMGNGRARLRGSLLNRVIQLFMAITGALLLSFCGDNASAPERRGPAVEAPGGGGSQGG